MELTFQRIQEAARPAASPPPAQAPAVLAQRTSTFGSGAPVAAPAIVEAGSPLGAATRGAMEASFGRDFGHIRVHDDARAHDDARSLGARAYTAGDHIVFGEGAYRPDTPRGDALIAHELAHSVQQDGVQMKPDGSVPAAADAELEGQADRAALDATAGRSVTRLGRIGRPAIFRANGDPPAAPEAASPEAAGSGSDLPSDVQLVEETPRGKGATVLVVELPLLMLPAVKGKGPWVREGYAQMASGGRLIFSPIADGKALADAPSIKAFMEKPGDRYKDIWLNNYGFTDLRGMAKAIDDAALVKPDVKAVTDKPEVRKILAGFHNNKLPPAECDIDHVVEKQLGGTSVPSNLQLLISSKNQASGRETYAAMVAHTRRILEHRPQVRTFQIRFRDAMVPDDAEDGSYHIELLLRTQGAIVGSAEVMAKGEGTPVQLVAGGASEVIRARASGATPVEASVRRLIPGMKFIEYRRGPGSSPTKGTDTVQAELASKPLVKGDKDITLTATIGTPPPGPDPSAGVSAAEKAGASEVRSLTLDKARNKDISFYYPYLSRGRLTRLEVDEQRNLVGEGVITPSVRFLGELKVGFGPDRLDLLQPIDVDAINSSRFMKPVASIFRFTNGSVAIDLVRFKPSGTLEFEVGPKPKPVILGTLNATEEGGSFVATGTLRPAGSIPGITGAKGEVKYRSDTGWAGLLEATSSSIPNSTTTVKLGFKEDRAGRLDAYGEGSISTSVRGARLDLNVGWNGRGLSYRGAATVKDPMPFVESVRLAGSYTNETLLLTGNADIKWKSIKSTMAVAYRRKDGDEEGKFSGKADILIKTDKAGGTIRLSFDEEGRYWGKGSITYQVTKDVRPTLGVELTKDRRVRMFGEVSIADVPLTRMWPSPTGGTLVFIKGAGLKFSIPTPVPGITAYGEVKVKAGLRYGVGPVTLRGLIFIGELYPLEDDPQVKATVKGKLAVPAYGELYGTFGAYIGVEVALGAVGAKGGIEVTPALRIEGEGGLAMEARYEAMAFVFTANAYAKGRMLAKLDVDLLAELYAAWGLFSHTWTYKVAKLEKQIGPELTLTLGQISYRNGEMTWPSVSQISLEPKELNPLDLVRDLLRSGKAVEN